MVVRRMKSVGLDRHGFGAFPVCSFAGLVSWEMTNLTLGHDNSGVWRNAF